MRLTNKQKIAKMQKARAAIRAVLASIHEAEEMSPAEVFARHDLGAAIDGLTLAIERIEAADRLARARS